MAVAKTPQGDSYLYELEILAADLANQGADVGEASKILDRLKASTNTLTLNDDLNRTRVILHYAPKRLEHSHTFKPYLFMIFELIVIGLWTWLILANSENYMKYLSSDKWQLLQTIYVSVIAGSIGATTFAIYGIYTHLIHRNMDTGFHGWYIARPVVGGVIGAFIGMTITVILNGVSASGDASHIVTIAVAFLAGTNEKFAAQMIERFTSKVLGIGPKETGKRETQEIKEVAK
ncbi:hypothetical protein [Paenibacillus sp. GP183]|uniref:hypothetical protein n=1 Tax=Paenibacillus sp. GP183 TaxID=1882751 RepID=UPI000899116F|nr:hypothetical protein [Paenibacillus sp. GP183]SEB93890.1 hypothetical protein SAMN05443246_2417 [Paenibacillus sp. GP183]